jgi:hypothetical protein
MEMTRIGSRAWVDAAFFVCGFLFVKERKLHCCMQLGLNVQNTELQDCLHHVQYGRNIRSSTLNVKCLSWPCRELPVTPRFF